MRAQAYPDGQAERCPVAQARGKIRAQREVERECRAERTQRVDLGDDGLRPERSTKGETERGGGTDQAVP